MPARPANSPRDSPLASKDRANSSADSRLRRAQLLGFIPLLEHARARQGRVVLLDAYEKPAF